MVADRSYATEANVKTAFQIFANGHVIDAQYRGVGVRSLERPALA